jgi:hypothetical protein
MQEIIAFARSQSTFRAPCYALVSAWLKHNGVKNVPSDTQARKWWLTIGPEAGLANGANIMRLKETPPQIGNVAVVEQSDGDPLLAIVGDNDFCVVRSFGRLVVWKPKIIRSWGLSWVRP